MNKKVDVWHLIAFFLALTLAGCVTQKGFKDHMDAYIGHSIYSFMSNTGYSPVNVQDTGSGKIYFFQVSKTGYYTMPTTTNATVTGSGNTAYGSATTYGGATLPMHKSCNWAITTNQSGKIVQWSARGNACVN